MSLNIDVLRVGLLSWFRNPRNIADCRQAEKQFAEIYHAYAQDAVDVSGDRVLNLQSSRFRDELNFSLRHGAQQFCLRLDHAFVTYWTGAVFAVGILPPALPACPNVGGSEEFSIETTSVVTTVTPRVLYTALIPIVSHVSMTAEGSAEKFARALDQATRRAVSVLISGMDTTPKPVGPLPLTNLCGVF